ncbi:MAG TPA: hypothetical protein VLM40_03985, partial [Gemmata sp.]|nr:hypothetical protein [Gemmata sp.]
MNPLPADLESLIPRIAELRAEGSGWLPIARELGYDIAELKSICAETGAFFTRLYRKSHVNVVREGMAEAIYSFRQQMRKVDDTAVRRGAEGMSRIGLAFDRQRLAEKRLRLQYA